MEKHLHVKSVLCHFRPVRAYRLLLLLLLSMSSPPTMSGSEHRGVAMSFSVASSGRSHGVSDATCLRPRVTTSTLALETFARHPYSREKLKG